MQRPAAAAGPRGARRRPFRMPDARPAGTSYPATQLPGRDPFPGSGCVRGVGGRGVSGRGMEEKKKKKKGGGGGGGGGGGRGGRGVSGRGMKQPGPRPRNGWTPAPGSARVSSRGRTSTPATPRAPALPLHGRLDAPVGKPAGREQDHRECPGQDQLRERVGMLGQRDMCRARSAADAAGGAETEPARATKRRAFSFPAGLRRLPPCGAVCLVGSGVRDCPRPAAAVPRHSLDTCGTGGLAGHHRPLP